MGELLISPLRLEPHPSLPLPADLFGEHPGSRANSTGLDLTVAAMRDPLLAALQTAPVPVVPEFDVKHIPGAYAQLREQLSKVEQSAGGRARCHPAPRRRCAANRHAAVLRAAWSKKPSRPGATR